MPGSSSVTYKSQFCSQCHNLMYIRTTEDGRSSYVCRFDPSHVELDRVESDQRHFDKRIVAVVRTYGDSSVHTGHSAGARPDGGVDPDAADLLADPTLPRIKFRCKYAAGGCEGDLVVATRINHGALVFKYVCTTCNRSWVNKTH